MISTGREKLTAVAQGNGNFSVQNPCCNGDGLEVVPLLSSGTDQEERTKSRFLFFFGFIGRLVYPAFNGVLEFSDALAQSPAKVRQLARPEDDQNDQQDKEQMGWLKQTFHFKLLLVRIPTLRIAYNYSPTHARTKSGLVADENHVFRSEPVLAALFPVERRIAHRDVVLLAVPQRHGLPVDPSLGTFQLDIRANRCFIKSHYRDTCRPAPATFSKNSTVLLVAKYRTQTQRFKDPLQALTVADFHLNFGADLIGV